MAVEQITRAVDDLDRRSTATREVLVGLDGEWRVLDVSASNYDKVVAAVGKFFECGRPRGQKPEVIKKVVGPTGEVETEAPAADPAPVGRQGDPEVELRARVRAWASENNIRINIRGKLRQEVWDAFYAAHPGLLRDTANAT